MQHTIESLKDKKECQEIKESKITEEAILELLQITVFMVKKHWTHTNNYEDVVRFIGTDLSDEVPKEYLILEDLHKNATYLTVNTITQFIKTISKWMRKKTYDELR